MNLREAMGNYTIHGSQSILHLCEQVRLLGERAKTETQEGNLDGLQETLTTLQGAVADLDKTVIAASTRLCRIVPTQTEGQVVDLSVPSSERK